MRTALAFVATLGASLGLSSIAAAQESLSEYSYTTRNRTPVESPQNVAIEIRVGRYVPNVDSDFPDPPRPYETTFGNDSRYSIGFEVDYQALRIPFLGTLGPGVGFSYTKSTGKGFVRGEIDGQREEDTSLIIFPMYLVGVLRADYLARNTPVPFVPYAKLGIGFAPWIVTNPGGTANVNGEKGKDISWGPQFALGGMLLLDAIDPNAAMELDGNTGVNNSYFFVEWYVSKLDGFGSGNQMNVGTNTWVLGLAMEM